MNYYERHIGDYLKDTAHLSLLEHGVYTRLMDVYYTREGPIPESDAARLIGARSRDERAALKAVLDEFFKRVDGACTQDRCDKEIARYQDKQRKAKASADARWSHSERNANASNRGDATGMRTHSERNADGMPRARVPSPQSPVTRPKNTTAHAPPPDGVSDSVWGDFLKIRKAKRAPMTDTALTGIRVEAEKAGLSLQNALSMCCARGWQGFEAKWLSPEERAAGNQFAGAI